MSEPAARPADGGAEQLTPEQARAVSAPGSVAVVAGAGTGKTKMLAHRYLHHLDQGLSPLQVVAVTFTEKAAAELRSRIRALARSRRSENRRALVELEAAQISTIHALAARICREHPERAGVSADFRLLDDLERAIWKSARLEEAIVALPAAVHAHLHVTLLRRLLATLLDDPVVAEEALVHGPERWRELLAAEQDAAFGEVTGDPEWATLRALLASVAGAEGDKGEAARRACLEAMTAFETRDAQRALELVNSFRTNAGQQRNWPHGTLPEAKAAFAAVKRLVKTACEDGRVLLSWGPADDALAAALPGIRLAFHAARDHLEAAKRRERALDFADLERHALKALEHEEVRQHYSARWRAVLVDEFQDTNPVQARILDHLEGAAQMTVVGDEKQAIYGFRGADVEVFRRYRRSIEERGGEQVTLSRSFRTHASLLESLEGVFAGLLGDLHQPLSAVRRPEEATAPHLTFHPLVATGRMNRAARQLCEAYEIAKLIRELVDNRYPVFEDGAWRPVEFGDVAILARGRASFDTYAQVLPALGVPAVDTGGGNLLDTRPAGDGVAALRFFADPSDDLALAALLRSPFFAVDDLTLYRFARSLAKDQAWWPALAELAGAGLGAETDGGPHLQRAAAVLAELLPRRWRHLPSRMLQELDELAGYSAVIANLPGGRRRLADWRGFAALVRALEAGQLDAFAVTRQLRQLRLADIEVPRPTLHPRDAVSLMTIHKSKGLEWPVVLVADLSYEGGGNGPGDVAFDPACGVSVRFRDEDGEPSAPILHSLLHRRRQRREAQELRRLLYVAMTRARDRLLLSTSERERGAMRSLLPALEAAGTFEVAFGGVAGLPFPDAPQPELGELGLRLEPTLANFELPAATEPPTATVTEASDAADWDSVMALVSELDPGWLPVAETLRDAGLPSPGEAGVFAELSARGAPTGQTAAFLWRSPAGEVALIASASAGGDYDQRTVTLNAPSESGAAALALAELLQARDEAARGVR